jgi:glycosyltransferase involved in cell wall biosynthesis
MSLILGFATYPIRHPVHGGQRRVAAFADFYKKLGLNYECVCIYEPLIYSADKIGPYDVALGYVDGDFAGIPFLGDLLSGMYGSQKERVFEHFLNLVRERNPAAIVLEQPFMWPLVERLRADPGIAKIPLVYSSQNWEGPLKYAVLISNGIDGAVARKIEARVEELERDAVKASHLIFAVSEYDAAIYRRIDPAKRVVVINNGVVRSDVAMDASRSLPDQLRDSRYLFFVGSAYPPNIDGVCDLLLDGGLFFLPPQASLVICGGAAHGILYNPRYQRFLAANKKRVLFYPTISDEDLEILKSHAHAILLPIDFGGGSNIKTAEALASGKWIVATSTAMRGFEDFMSEPGVVIADGRPDFRKAVIKVYNTPSLDLSDTSKQRRESVYWDRCFEGVSLVDLGLFTPELDRPTRQMKR